MEDGWISSMGVKLPRILYGTAWKKERTAELVAQALRTGFRGIDTACQPKHYDEAGAGAGIAAALKDGLTRQELYIQTKFTPFAGQDPERVPYDPSATLAQQVAQSFAQSQKNLQIDTVDSLVLHSPLATALELNEVWGAMERLVDGNCVRQLGVSNCYDLAQFQALYENARIKPAVLQNRFYAKTGYDRALRRFCDERRVIYQSFWTLTANPEVLSAPRLADIAKRRGLTAQQVFFRALSQAGIVPLSGTTQTKHMADDVAISSFELTPEECQGVFALLP